MYSSSTETTVRHIPLEIDDYLFPPGITIEKFAEHAGVIIQDPEIVSVGIPLKIPDVRQPMVALHHPENPRMSPAMVGSAPAKHDWASILELIALPRRILGIPRLRPLFANGLNVLSPMEVFEGQSLLLMCLARSAVISFTDRRFPMADRTFLAAGLRHD